MSTEHIQITRDDHVQRIVICRPRKLNSLTADMYQAMTDALVAGEADDGVRVHLITGEGKAFTAGNDVGSFLNPAEGMPIILRFLETLRTLQKPLVASVNGIAVGIGVTLLLHADLVYAADTATFRTPFVDLGLVPEAGSSLLMPAAMGYPRAARMLLLGEVFDAQQAYESQLVGEVVSAGELQPRAEAAARRLASRAPAALRAAKALMRQPRAEALEAQMAHEIAVFERQLASPELVEAVSAFLEKRAPDFSRFS